MLDRGPLLLAPVLLVAPLAGCLGDADPGDQRIDPAATGAVDEGFGELEAGHALTGFRGAEPTIGVKSDGSLFVVAFDRMIESEDGGRSWSERWAFATEDNGVAREEGLLRNHDPMMAVDPVTDRVTFAGMWPAASCAYLAWSDDGGDTWTERGPACPGGDMDHQKFVSGPPPADAPPAAGERHPSVAYLCYSSLALAFDGDPYADQEARYSQTRCSASYDGGLSWRPAEIVSDRELDGCGVPVGAPDVGPEGTAAVPVPCQPPRIAVSEDAGESWQLVEVPSQQPIRGDDPMIRFGPNGTLWMAYTGQDNQTHVIGTPDLGETWLGPIDVTPPDVNSTVFNAMGVGDDGRLAVAYVGTADSEWADDAGDDARWHLHVAALADASEDPRLETVQVTPDGDPVQIGRICMSGVTCEGSRNLLDFIGGTVAPNGTFYVSYTDGCVDACANETDAGAEDSRARRTAVAWLDGWPLERPTSTS